MIRIDTCIAEEGTLLTTYVVPESQKCCTVRPKESFQSIVVGRVPDVLFAALEAAVAAQNEGVTSELALAAASWFTDKDALVDLITVHLLTHSTSMMFLYRKHANPEYTDLLAVLSRRPEMLEKETKHESEN